MRKRAPLLAGLLLPFLTAACSSDDESATRPLEPVPLAKINREAWAAAIHAADPDTLPNPDLDALYDVTLDVCEQDVDDLTLMFTLEGAQPMLTRVNVQRVCPSHLEIVDQAITELDELSRHTAELCSSDPTSLSAADAEEYDAVCVDY